MVREEEIKQYCADQGFPYGACSSISSLKAYIATEAIKWADEHPSGSRIKWQTGVPEEAGFYLVTTIYGEVKTSTYIKAKAIDYGFFRLDVVAWCKLSDIKPYIGKEGQK